MKKILSFLLVMILTLSSMCAVSATADENNGAEQLCLEKFTDYIRNSPSYEPDDNFSASIDLIGELNGYYVCCCEYGIVIPQEVCYNLDGYVFEADNEYTYTDEDINLPIMFINENECLSFSEAYDRGVFAVDAIAGLINSVNHLQRIVAAYKIGDVDRSGVINVLDATAIQKYLADLENFYSFNKELADVNCDGTVNVLDATAIQKYCAKIITALG